MNEKEIKAKLEQAFASFVMTQSQKDILKNIIIELVQTVNTVNTESSSISTLSNNSNFDSIELLNEDATIDDVITTVNSILSTLKQNINL